tara:strand:- start:1755 stop:4304 length:2550 start_codon:yes stop_codon:yes gene_type:complete
MPRQYLRISDFSGGLNTRFDARDIEDNELTDASSVQVYKSGQIYSSRASETVTSRASGSITSGKGLFLFKSDNDLSNASKSIELLALSDVATGRVDIIEDPFNTISARDITGNAGTNYAFDLGTNHAGGEQVYYYVDGALRVCDAETGQTGNTAYWYGHVDRATGGATSFQVGGGAYNDDPTITHTSSDDIYVGALVSGSGIPAGAYVASITDSTHFELSASTTGGSKTGQTLTFGGAVNTWVTATNNLAAPSATNLTTTGSAQYAALGLGFDVDVTVETTDDDGLWEATTYEFAQSFIYEGNQESLLTLYSESVTLSTNNYFTNVLVGVITPFSPRIKGGRIYIRKKDSTDLWTLFLDIDLERGVRKDMGDTFTAWHNPSSDNWKNNGGIEIKGPSIDTYESNNGYSPDIGHLSFGEAAGLFYKDVTICNQRAFVAHVNYYTPIGGAETKLMPDRILYTPIGKYDTFPPNQFIDIGINDGEDFTALESFGTKLLAFKQSTLYIIDVTSSNDLEWFLESTHKGLGVDKPTAIVRTEIGICWANTNGVYMWSPNQGITNLSVKLDKDFAPLSGIVDPVVGFFPPKSQLLIVQDCTKASDMLVYDFITKSFTKLTSYTAEKVTNMQNNVDACIWLEGATDNETVKKYLPTQGTTNIAFSFTTKDFDFGNPAVTKKIQKIIVSYSTGIGLDSVSSDTGVITGLTGANPGVVTSADHGLSNGQVVRIDDVGGMTQVNDTLFTTANVATNTFQLSGVDTSGYTSYSSGGTWSKATAGVAVTTTYFKDGDTDATGTLSSTWPTAAQNGIINIDASDIGTVSTLRLKFSATGCYKINDITVIYRTRMRPPTTAVST